MIRDSQKNNPDSYSFIAGMRNVAWLAGYARNLDLEGSRIRSMLVQQTNNLNLALPVSFAPEARLQSGFNETYPIKLTCHVFGRRLENGERVAEMRAINAETPTLLDMPGLAVWDKVRPKGAPVDGFKPLSANDDQDAKGRNVVRLAGFVYSAMLATDAEGKVQKDCLIVLLRQHEDPDKCIPIRVYGRYAAPYQKRVQPGTPVVFTGEFRVRVKKVKEAETEDGIDEVVKYPYIHASHVRVADPNEIRNVPDWAREQMERIRALRAGRTQPGSKEAEAIATGGHPRVVYSNVAPQAAQETVEEVAGPDFGDDLG
ncbi:hypothetical protein [Thauera aminoaromatica]|uniref:Uncharacterized protein n=1 Tax=Thauera aminoaromatica TaxID=164330 RepID=A0A5C7T8H5_THASP|nr:hypothetical protein [Thauera aminoaromatica]TXH92303.1 MAG: hypothetical protein E6Q80_00760 [Thauera aminoaromatica]